MTDKFETRLADFVAAVDAYIAEHYRKNLTNLFDKGLFPKIELERGVKYIRVVEAEQSGRRVYCFLDLQGNIYKAESWKKPAKHVRGSIFDENFSLGKGLTVYGGAYLR